MRRSHTDSMRTAEQKWNNDGFYRWCSGGTRRQRAHRFEQSSVDTWAKGLRGKGRHHPYHHRTKDRPLAAHLLSLPERQCARIADEDPREVLQLCGEDRFHGQSPSLWPVRHRDVSWQRELAERLGGIRERGVSAPGQRSDEQWLLRLGHNSYSRWCENHVV